MKVYPKNQVLPVVDNGQMLLDLTNQAQDFDAIKELNATGNYERFEERMKYLNHIMIKILKKGSKMLK